MTISFSIPEDVILSETETTVITNFKTRLVNSIVFACKTEYPDKPFRLAKEKTPNMETEINVAITKELATVKNFHFDILVRLERLPKDVYISVKVIRETPNSASKVRIV